VARTGRPKLPAGKRKAGRIEIRVTEAERSLMEAAAERDGKTLSEWIRNAAVKAVSGKRIRTDPA
jgi:uncharacterized protein (DUF1778 family)